MQYDEGLTQIFSDFNEEFKIGPLPLPLLPPSSMQSFEWEDWCPKSEERGFWGKRVFFDKLASKYILKEKIIIVSV